MTHQHPQGFPLFVFMHQNVLRRIGRNVLKRTILRMGQNGRKYPPILHLFLPIVSGIVSSIPGKDNKPTLREPAAVALLRTL